MFRRLTLAGLFILALTHPALTQTQITTGVVQGTVTDATGALLPGVTVEARNAGTNLTRTLTTEADGRFVFLQLPPGTYSVKFTLAGFATLIQQEVPVTVGQSVTLPIAMKVGGVSETVTVTTGTSVIESTRTGSATTLNSLTVEHLPNLGRKFEDLLSLTPGVSIVQGPDGDEITFAGQRGVFNNISLDGGDYNNGFFGEQAGGQRAAVDITLEAIKEFQVIATGAPAEFGRTAGGVVNVITKSGTNQRHGSLFHFQRLAGLTGDLSDGTKLEDFHREQWGGTYGGPLKQDKAFIFAALEGITGNFKRPNLGRQLGATPCPVNNPTVQQNEALINANPDCQRTALLAFFNGRGQNEASPIEHPVKTIAFLGKLDFIASQNNNVSGSWNFNHSRKTNETFDVATYGSSANGIEGNPARINVLNLNWFTTLSARMLNEAHFTYARESRPRAA
ncbi:MAG: TonB-dependent receptor, partial [Vicinamibacterales bacterium]